MLASVDCRTKGSPSASQLTGSSPCSNSQSSTAPAASVPPRQTCALHVRGFDPKKKK
jgi:hypothetical protein